MTTRKLNVTGQKSRAADCVVQYYAPWCGLLLAPVYAQVADQAPSNVHVVRFNMDKHGAEVKAQKVGAGTPVAQDVRGFPTVIMYKKDGARSVYTGPRNADAMLDAIRAHYNAPPPVLRGGGGGGEYIIHPSEERYYESKPLIKVDTPEKAGIGELKVYYYKSPLRPVVDIMFVDTKNCVHVSFVQKIPTKKLIEREQSTEKPSDDNSINFVQDNVVVEMLPVRSDKINKLWNGMCEENCQAIKLKAEVEAKAQVSALFWKHLINADSES